MSVKIQASSNSGSEGSGAQAAPASAEGGAGAPGASSPPESTDGTPSPGENEEPEAPAAAMEEPETDPEASAEAPEKPAFKAREKFKVLDKEHAVPDWLKAIMKDEGSEKQAIELLEKAYGLEPVKEERAQVRKERDQFKTNLQGVLTQVQELREIYQNGDLDLWLDKLQVPHERVLQWALDKVNYSQLPPEQQRILDERNRARREAYLHSKQSAQFEQQSFERTREAKLAMLETSLARDDVKSFADAFDARVGKPGAFRTEVQRRGEYEWNRTNGKVDLTPEQAVQAVMMDYRGMIQPANPTPAPAAQGPTGGATGAAGAGTPPVVTSNKTGTIPTVGGKSQSPMTKKPRSLDDLKKIRDQKLAGANA
jgi:hypothetical protein